MADRQSLIAGGLVAIAVAGVMYAFVYPYLSGEIKAQKRTAALVSSNDRRREGRAAADPAKRRKMILESLENMETKSVRKATLEQRVSRAGLSVSPRLFLVGCAVFAAMTIGLVYLLNDSLLVASGAGMVAALGVPNWALSFLTKRRMTKFIDEFPGAVDIIIRGVRAGLPVADCFRMIATDAPEPVRSEFRQIVESQTIGLSVGEATERFAERLPIAETSFFSIVINLQQRSGGNLSEALANLANVLRERKKMKAKIRAMSAEAKASAGIIGSLPFLVGIAVWLTTPSYIAILFTTNVGNVVIAGGLLWMAIGVVIMKKMIDFDI